MCLLIQFPVLWNLWYIWIFYFLNLYLWFSLQSTPERQSGVTTTGQWICRNEIMRVHEWVWAWHMWLYHCAPLIPEDRPLSQESFYRGWRLTTCQAWQPVYNVLNITYSGHGKISFVMPSVFCSHRSCQAMFSLPSNLIYVFLQRQIGFESHEIMIFQGHATAWFQHVPILHDWLLQGQKEKTGCGT